MSRRKIAILSFARSDYSSLRPILLELRKRDSIDTNLIIGGSHLSREHGSTVDEIENEFAIAARLDTLASGDTRIAMAHTMAATCTAVAELFDVTKPDIALICGDRYELLAIAAAATAMGVPIAHISGGDITEGALDEQIRHAVTKLSHLHFVAANDHAERLRRMGEEPWRVIVSGDPALDSIRDLEPMSRSELEQSLGTELNSPLILLTYHAPTLDNGSSELNALCEALRRIEGTVIVSGPNADPGNSAVSATLSNLAGSRPNTILVKSLGQRRYYSLMAIADAMAGNSSSGIWEAPSFRLPVVNVGRRQHGRMRAPNVIDVGDATARTIESAIRRALQPEFRRSISTIRNPYGDGSAAVRIADQLEGATVDATMLHKRFYDVDRGTP